MTSTSCEEREEWSSIMNRLHMDASNMHPCVDNVSCLGKKYHMCDCVGPGWPNNCEYCAWQGGMKRRALRSMMAERRGHTFTEEDQVRLEALRFARQ